MKILAYMVQPYEEAAFKKWHEERGIQVDILKKELLTVETVEKAKGYDGVTTQQVIPIKDEAIFAKLEEFGIKQISSRTAGVDMFDGDLARKHNVAITNVPGYSPNAIAELAVSHATQLLRNVGKVRKAMTTGDFSWNHELLGREVRNCTVGIVGTGRIGLTAAKIFKGYGAKIIGYDVYKSDAAAEVLEYKETLVDLLKEADIISLHLPLIDSTHHIINKDNITHMKEGAILVNTGRGGLLNIDDVIEGLESGKIFAAGIDVLEDETLYVNQKIDNSKIAGKAAEKLQKMDNVVFTPHYAFFTDEAISNIVSTALDNLKTQFDTGKLVNATNI